MAHGTEGDHQPMESTTCQVSFNKATLECFFEVCTLKKRQSPKVAISSDRETSAGGK